MVDQMVENQPAMQETLIFQKKQQWCHLLEKWKKPSLIIY